MTSYTFLLFWLDGHKQAGPWRIFSWTDHKWVCPKLSYQYPMFRLCVTGDDDDDEEEDEEDEEDELWWW